MRILAITALLLIPLAGSAERPRVLPENAAYTYAALALLVGHYYVAQHAWPTSMEQLRGYIDPLARREFHADERKGLKEIWSSFTHIEFSRRGKDVLLSTRFRSEGHEYSYAAVLHPGNSSEEILDRMTPK